MSKSRSFGSINSVGKAMAILDEISKSPDGLRLVDIAKHFDLEKSSVHRLLATMETYGLVAKSTGKRYLLGLKLYRLGLAKQAAMPFRRMAVPFLKELSSRTGETAVLSALESTSMFFLEKEEGPHMIRGNIDLGQHQPVCQDAFGKAMLAFQTDSFVDNYLDHNPLSMSTTGEGSRSPQDVKALRKQLEMVRTAGFGTDHEEREEGLYGLSAPVISGGVSTAAIGIIYPKSRFSAKREKEMAVAVKDVGKRLSNELFG